MTAIAGLFPGHRSAPPHPRPGLTSAQAGELARLQARYGRCGYARRRDGHLLVKAFGDNPFANEAPLVVLLNPLGHVVHAHGGDRRIPISPQPPSQDASRDLPILKQASRHH